MRLMIPTRIQFLRKEMKISVFKTAIIIIQPRQITTATMMITIQIIEIIIIIATTKTAMTLQTRRKKNSKLKIFVYANYVIRFGVQIKIVWSTRKSLFGPTTNTHTHANANKHKYSYHSHCVCVWEFDEFDENFFQSSNTPFGKKSIFFFTNILSFVICLNEMKWNRFESSRTKRIKSTIESFNHVWKKTCEHKRRKTNFFFWPSWQ